MNRIKYTLVTDGSSDRLLRFTIDWLLDQLTSIDFDGDWADPATFGNGRSEGLRGRVAAALDCYPCQLLFVHRDAEKEPREERVAEILEAVQYQFSPPPAVCLVPIRMTEAWLLIDELSLREAAGNPNGRAGLDLPRTRELEALPNPKKTLFDLLKDASELTGRRLRRFREGQARQRLAELIEDYSPLEQLSAFQAFRSELSSVLVEHGWN